MGGIMKVTWLSCIGVLMGGINAVPVKHYEHHHTTTEFEFRLPMIPRREQSFRNETKSSTVLAETSKTPTTSLIVDTSSTSEVSTSIPSTSISVYTPIIGATTSTLSLSNGPISTISETLLAPESSRGSSVGPTTSTVKDGSRTLLSSSIPQHPSSTVLVVITSSPQDAPQVSASSVLSSVTPTLVDAPITSTLGGQESLPFSVSTLFRDVSEYQSTLNPSYITTSDITSSSAVPPTLQPPSSSTLLILPTPSLRASLATTVLVSTSHELTSSYVWTVQSSSIVVLPSSLSSSTPISPVTATPTSRSNPPSTIVSGVLPSIDINTSSTLVALISSKAPLLSSHDIASQPLSASSSLRSASVEASASVSGQGSLINIPPGSSSVSSTLSSTLVLTSSTTGATIAPTIVSEGEGSSLLAKSQSSGLPPSELGSLVPTPTFNSSQSVSVGSTPGNTLAGLTSLSTATPPRSQPTQSSLTSLTSASLSGISLILDPVASSFSTVRSSLGLIATTSAQPAKSIATISLSDITVSTALSSVGLNRFGSIFPTLVISSDVRASTAPAASVSSVVSTSVDPSVVGNATAPASTGSSRSVSIDSQSITISIATQTPSLQMTASPTSGSLESASPTTSLAPTLSSFHGNNSMPSSHGPSSRSLDPGNISETASFASTAVILSSSTSIITDNLPKVSQTTFGRLILNITSSTPSQAATTGPFLSLPWFPIVQTISSNTILIPEIPQPSNVNQTRIQSSLAIPTAYKYTASNIISTLATLPSTRSISMQSAHPASTASTSAHSSMSESRSSSRPSRTLIPILPPIPSASESILAAPAPDSPILTPSQTAGVAAASFAGILLAAIAVVFLVRRYQSSRAARPASTSTNSSVYPKLGYLYDPPVNNRSIEEEDSDDDEPVLMSGGAGGLPPQGEIETRPASIESSGEACREMSPFSDPGNPFRNSRGYFRASKDIFDSSQYAPVAEATAVLKSMVQEQEYTMASQWSTTTSASSTPTRAFHDHIIPSPTLSPFIGSLRRSHARAGSSKRSVRSMRQFATASTFTTPSVVATSHRTQSLHGRFSYHTQTSPRDSGTSDPFEHDLLLPIDSWTETRDSVFVYAPSPTCRVPRRPHLPTSTHKDNVPAKPPFKRFNSNNPYRPSPQSPNPPTITAATDRQPTPIQPSIPSPTQTAINSPDPNSPQPHSPKSPISPPYAPTHLGWDAIKRLSKTSCTAFSPTSTSPSYSPYPVLLSPTTTTASTPPPKKKKSFIKLRRKDGPLAGVDVAMPRTSVGGGLNIMVPVKWDQGVGVGVVAFEGPKESLLKRVHSLVGRREG
ncbi:hypothetical protein T440DRAFT_320985 [Plenodomus tracheiphilus IPT5]|uniref:REJ domain-containing protein n=1 Tax=Plenodomus tracheiphilus IPT5 TaxID=1408161 RepID=A0A6A7BFR2_9PLEO|nr:hypothetical protein T440DRAFT_320985 [Plenodomus tracheiphilus IPT5]